MTPPDPRQPLLQLWPQMSADLQGRLLGAHSTHGKLSVKKAVAALASATPALTATLAHISSHSEPLPHCHLSLPAPCAEASLVSLAGRQFKCSKYIDHTCQQLLLEGASGISCEDFFLRLVAAGPSPLLSRWQRDGFTAERIRQILLTHRASAHGAHPHPITLSPSPAHSSPPLTSAHGAHPHPITLSPSPAHSSPPLTSAQGGQTSKDLFISYSHSPHTLPMVQRLQQDLQEAGYSVWLDTADIASGSNWHSAIGEGVRDCRALLALLSERYINSKYCRNELFMADSIQKPIFPVLLETVDLSSRAASGVQYVVTSLNHIDIAMAGYEASLASLLHGLTSAGISPRPPSPQPS